MYLNDYCAVMITYSILKNGEYKTELGNNNQLIVTVDCYKVCFDDDLYDAICERFNISNSHDWDDIKAGLYSPADLLKCVTDFIDKTTEDQSCSNYVDWFDIWNCCDEDFYPDEELKYIFKKEEEYNEKRNAGINLLVAKGMRLGFKGR